jgi:hypothetical protein
VAATNANAIARRNKPADSPARHADQTPDTSDRCRRCHPWPHGACARIMQKFAASAAGQAALPPPAGRRIPEPESQDPRVSRMNQEFNITEFASNPAGLHRDG